MPHYNAIETNLNFEKRNNNIICYSGILILSLSLSLKRRKRYEFTIKREVIKLKKKNESTKLNHTHNIHINCNGKGGGGLHTGITTPLPPAALHQLVYMSTYNIITGKDAFIKTTHFLSRVFWNLRQFERYLYIYTYNVSICTLYKPHLMSTAISR